MKKGTWTILIVAVILILAIWAGFAYFNRTGDNGSTTGTSSATSTATNTAPVGGNAGGIMLPAFDKSLSSDGLTINYPATDFNVATSEQELADVQSYIPPCNQGFSYCLYYIGNRFAGTNFESAGIAWTNRTDLTTQSSCLSTDPEGYTGLTAIVASSSDYAVSAFVNVGGAAAGHFANDTIYRIAHAGTCEEFDMRVGQSDFENYPSGSIQQFTTADSAAIQFEMQAMLGTLTFANGEHVTLPQTSSSTNLVQ